MAEVQKNMNDDSTSPFPDREIKIEEPADYPDDTNKPETLAPHYQECMPSTSTYVTSQEKMSHQSPTNTTINSQELAQNRILNISKNAVVFKSIKDEAIAFLKSWPFDGRPSFLALEKRVIEELENEVEFGQHDSEMNVLKIIHVFKLKMSDSCYKKLETLGQLEMRDNNIISFVSNDGRFRIEEPTGENIVSFMTTISHSIEEYKTFVDLVNEFHQWRKNRYWGPVDRDSLMKQFMNLGKLIPKATPYVHCLHLEMKRRTKEKITGLYLMKLVELDFSVEMMDGPDEEKVLSFTIPPSRLDEFREELVKLRKENPRNDEVFIGSLTNPIVIKEENPQAQEKERSICKRCLVEETVPNEAPMAKQSKLGSHSRPTYPQQNENSEISDASSAQHELVVSPTDVDVTEACSSKIGSIHETGSTLKDGSNVSSTRIEMNDSNVTSLENDEQPEFHSPRQQQNLNLSILPSDHGINPSPSSDGLRNTATPTSLVGSRSATPQYNQVIDSLHPSCSESTSNQKPEQKKKPIPKYSKEETDDLMDFVVAEMKKIRDNFVLAPTCSKYQSIKRSIRGELTLCNKVTKEMRDRLQRTNFYTVEERILIYFCLKWPLHNTIVKELISDQRIDHFELDKEGVLVYYSSPEQGGLHVGWKRSFSSVHHEFWKNATEVQKGLLNILSIICIRKRVLISTDEIIEEYHKQNPLPDKKHILDELNQLLPSLHLACEYNLQTRAEMIFWTQAEVHEFFEKKLRRYGELTLDDTRRVVKYATYKYTWQTYRWSLSFERDAPE